MKTMKKFLSMTALALVGAMMTSCSSDDSIIDNPQQPENTGKTVTLTTIVGLDGSGEAGVKGITRALTSGGVKTFAADETMAIVYKNTSGTTVKAVSAALTAGDITNEGKNATFTFTLEDPNKTENVTYIYPATMANSDGSINYAALNSQNGTLATLASNLDLATYSGAWNAGTLPTGTLTNQLAILAITLKNNAATPAEITSSITGMTLSDGTNTYSVSPSSLSTIYVAIRPTASANIEVTATDGSTNYTKSLTDKTYAAGNGYNVSWRMVTYPVALNAVTTSDYVGSVITSDGYVYAKKSDATADNKTAVAIIAYVGSAGSVDESSGIYKGLAIAMSDCGSDWMHWTEKGNDIYVDQAGDIITAIGYKNGIDCTNTLSNDDGHTAAIAAASNNNTAAPAGTSGWFLPSMGQWNLILQGLATKKQGTAVTTNIPYGDTFDTYTATNLNSVITAAGGTEFESNDYWSSTQYEYDEDNDGEAWSVQLGEDQGSAWECSFEGDCYVRSALAF